MRTVEVCDIFNLIFNVFALSVQSEYVFRENLQKKIEGDFITRYEKCFILLDHLNSSSALYEQSACLKENEPYPPKLPFIDNLITSCHLGYVLPDYLPLNDHTNVTRYMHTRRFCQVRNIKQRNGLRSLWHTSDDYRIKEKSFAISLGEILKRFNIRSIDLRGDSVMMQVAKYFACDLTRSSNVTLFSHRNLMDPEYRKRSLEKYVNFGIGNFSIGSFSFDLTSSLVRLNCILLEPNHPKCHSNDSSERNEFVYYSLLETLKNTVLHATPSNPAILIFNAGLHIHKHILNGNIWIIEPVVKALLDSARTSLERYFVFFRETSAQHFNGREGGLYWGRATRAIERGKRPSFLGLLYLHLNSFLW